MFQRALFAATALAFAGLGVAVAAEAITVELKDFKLKSAFEDSKDGVALNEGDAKIGFYTEGTAVATVKIAEDGEYDIVIEASCDEAEKVKAKMTVKVGDEVVKENFELKVIEAKEYTFTAKLKKGETKLSIAFTNDAFEENKFDRNLYVHKVKIEKSKK